MQKSDLIKFRKNKFCLDCHKPLSHYGLRCMKCWSKTVHGKNSPRYKHGKFIKDDFKCIECGTSVCLKGNKCYSCANKLSNHPNWQGGLTSLKELIRHLPESIQWRTTIFKRDNYTCQECKQIGGKLEAHHIKEMYKLLREFLKKYSLFSPVEDKETLVRLAITYKPFWRLKNGRTLCMKCHKRGRNKD